MLIVRITESTEDTEGRRKEMSESQKSQRTQKDTEGRGECQNQDLQDYMIFRIREEVFGGIVRITEVAEDAENTELRGFSPSRVEGV